MVARREPVEKEWGEQCQEDMPRAFDSVELCDVDNGIQNTSTSSTVLVDPLDYA